RSRHLSNYGGCACGTTAWIARPRGATRMNAFTPGSTVSNASEHRASLEPARLIPSLIIWVLLLAVPVWLPLIGGYTALGSRVLIFALAALGLNLLLGFTGGLSFGHA